METQVSFSQLLKLAFAGLVILVARLVLKSRTLNRRNRLPPGPTPWRMIGNLHILGGLVHQTLGELAKQYGPLMSIHLGSVHTIVVTSPKLAETFLKTHDQIWASRPSTIAFRAMTPENFSVMQYCPLWRYLRKVFTLELFTSKRLADYQKSREKEVIMAVQQALDECSAPGKVVNMNLVVVTMIMNIITSMLLNETVLTDKTRTATKESGMHDVIEDHFRLVGKINIGDFIPFLSYLDLQGLKKQMKATIEKKEAYLQLILDDHRKKQQAWGEAGHTEPKVDDLVDVMLTRPSDIDGKNLTDAQIRGMIQAVVFAGTHTTATTIEWGLAELIKNPRVLAKGRAEIDSVVGRDRLVCEADLPNLPYLQAICKEIFRLHPVGPLLVPHESLEDCVIEGYHIPAKTRLLVNVYAIGRDPEVWSNPLEFYPERHIGSKKDVHGSDFDLLPFGSGRRICPGKNMALPMVQYAVGALIHACAWSLPGGQKPETLDMTESFGLAITRKYPLQVVATPRLQRETLVTRLN